MKNIMIAVLFAFALILASVFPASADAIPLKWKEKAPQTLVYKELRNMVDVHGDEAVVGDIFRRLRLIPSKTDLRAIAVFLSEKTYEKLGNEEVHINFFLAFSDLYSLMARMETQTAQQIPYLQKMLTTMMLYEMLAMEDGMRCTDSSAWKNFKKAVIVPRVRDMRHSFGAISAQKFPETVSRVAIESKQFVQRPPNHILCKMGDQEITDETKVFISTSEWFVKRRQIPQIVQKYWLDRYNKMAQMSRQSRP